MILTTKRASRTRARRGYKQALRSCGPADQHERPRPAIPPQLAPLAPTLLSSARPLLQAATLHTPEEPLAALSFQKPGPGTESGSEPAMKAWVFPDLSAPGDTTVTAVSTSDILGAATCLALSCAHYSYLRLVSQLR